MNVPDHSLAMQAEELLAARFTRLRDPTKKLAAFRTPSGRQLALALERKEDIFVWAECHNGEIDGVAINNAKRPGLPYSPDQARSSAVNSQCSNLSIGSRAFYLRCESLGALDRFATWYATV